MSNYEMVNLTDYHPKDFQQITRWSTYVDDVKDVEEGCGLAGVELFGAAEVERVDQK